MIGLNSRSKTASNAVILSGDKIKDFRSAIVSDDLALCTKLLSADPTLAKLCFGRFPVLSLLYMYRSAKILGKFGKRFTRNEYIYTDEYPADYITFRGIAGRSLRLFVDSIVTPEDMLAVTGDAPTLRAAVGKRPNPDKVKKIAKIYSLSGNGKVKIKGDKIRIPHSRRMSAKQTIAVLLITVLSLLFAGGALWTYYAVPRKFGGDGSAQAPIFLYNAEQLLLASAEEGERYFVLKEDITLPATSLTGTTLKSHLNGDGHTLKITDKGDAPLLREVVGSIRNLTLDFGKLDLSFSADSAILATEVSGTIANVNLKASGNITDVSGNETVKFGCLTYKNTGTISNVEAAVDFTVTGASAGGTTSEDVTFACIAAINEGLVSYCSLTPNSSIALDTVDGAAIVADNMATGRVLDCTNNADISQTTAYHHWSPNLGGIVLNNYGTINNCINNGKVSCSSSVTKEEYELNNPDSKNSHTVVYAGGIVCNNYGSVNHSKNTGDIAGTSEYSLVYVGGIAAQTVSTKTSSSSISNCVAKGAITCASADEDAEEPSVRLIVGGITGYLCDYNGYYESNVSIIKNCFSLMSYTHSGFQYCFFGGIVGWQDISAFSIGFYSFTNYDGNTYLSGSGFVGGVGCIYNLFDYSYVTLRDITSGGTTPLSENDLVAKEYYW